jgi:MYXO-CTERM domain-containing protein
MKKVAALASVVCLSLLLCIPAFAYQDRTSTGIQAYYSVNQTDDNLNAKNVNTTGNENSTANQNGNYRAQAVSDENRGTNWSWLGLLGLIGLTGLRKRSSERS